MEEGCNTDNKKSVTGVESPYIHNRHTKKLKECNLNGELTNVFLTFPKIKDCMTYLPFPPSEMRVDT